MTVSCTHTRLLHTLYRGLEPDAYGGTSHTAEVTASSLFEAVAQGLSALRKNEWVEGIEERFGFVKVSVADVRVEHQVKIADFMKWLERPGRTPREVTHRLRIRSILGISVSR